MAIPISVFLGVRLSAISSVNRFVALTCRLAVIGIVLGTATLITVLSVMKGFDSEIRRSVVNQVDHLQIYAFNHYYPDSLYDTLRSLDHVKTVSGYAHTYGLIKIGKQYRPMMLWSFEDKQPQGIQLSGISLPEGTEVGVILPQESRMMPKTVNIPYSGEYSSHTASKGLITALVSRDLYQEISGKKALSGLSIAVDDLYATADIKAFLQKRYQGLYQGFDWRDKYQPMFAALRMQRMAMSIVLSMITLVSMFSLVSGLVMLSADRSREVALLRVMGFSKRQVRMTFMIQGLIIGSLGVFFGVLLGLLLSYCAPSIVTFLEGVVGYTFVDERLYGVATLPVHTEVKMVLGVASLGLFASLLASIYPAAKAAKSDPASVLRYD